MTAVTIEISGASAKSPSAPSRSAVPELPETETIARDLDRALAARDRCPDGEDAGDTSFSRASQDVVEVGREIGVIEVGVGFD